MKKCIVPSFVLFCFLFSSFIPAAQVTAVETVGITVRDMERSLPFYTGVLGFKKVNDQFYRGTEAEKLQGLFGLHARVVRLQLGDEFIELTDYLTTGGRSIPEDARSNDLYFQHVAIVVSDMDKAYAVLQQQQVVHVSTVPQTLPPSIPAAAGIRAFYFLDPDGHTLELIWFPKGKGAEKWQHPEGKLFLGIDHTAIGVSNSSASHSFYALLLGLEKKGESWNKGTEQEHLNNVEGASLHISGYRATSGPGVEFLEYLRPGPRRPYPSDSKPDDIWHWQTVLLTADATALYQKLRDAAAVFISTAPVAGEEGSKYSLRFLVRDPDGHALLIKEYLNN